MEPFKHYITRLIEQDTDRMEALRAAATLELPDWWIGDGFVRNKVWDALHDLSDGQLNDIDLLYFDADTIDPALERRYEAQLREAYDAPWSVKNQARMHEKNGNAPYTSTLDAMSHWVETATAVGVTLRQGRVVLGAPLGTADLVNCIVRQNPEFPHKDIFDARWREKGWCARWPRLRVIE